MHYTRLYYILFSYNNFANYTLEENYLWCKNAGRCVHQFHTHSLFIYFLLNTVQYISIIFFGNDPKKMDHFHFVVCGFVVL